jgi:integrative and conjugative element protein (TIGR02256 family)
VVLVVTVWLQALERDRLAEESARRRVVETGGPIFGYSTDDAVVVTRVFGPGPGARHRPTRFSADPAWIEACIDEVFASTDGKESYLGDWHSHPLGGSSPSGSDITAVRSIAADHEVGLDRPTVLIQATKIFRRRIHMGTLGSYRWDMDGEQLVAHELRVASLGGGLRATIEAAEGTA